MTGRILTVLLAVVLTASAAEEGSGGLKSAASRFAQMYFAPMSGGGFYRMCDPASGMVEFRRRADGSFAAPPGWSASAKGDSVTVTPPGGGGCAFRFKNGAPDTLVYGGKGYRIKVEGEERVLRGPVPEMWREDRSAAADPVNKKWPGRFTFFYRNPNREAVLFGSAALAFLALFLYASRRWAMVLGAACAVAAAVPVVLTKSRAGMLALALGAALLGLGRLFRGGGRRRVVSLAVAAVVAAGGFVAAGGAGRLLMGLGNKGDALRSVIAREAPRMMSDAPWGWSGTTAGRAFMDWYMPDTINYVTWTLVNGHYTCLVSMGWIGRFLWIFLWLGGIASLAWFARRGGNALPAALWTAFGAAAFFNPVLNSWTLWIVPVLSLALVAARRPWTEARAYVWPVAGGAAAAMAAVLFLWTAGSRASAAAQLQIRADGPRVLVNGGDPRVWVVDDEETLGWVTAAKEIRRFYKAVPKARPLGYVRRLSDLPKSVDRLVVAGKHCLEYVRLWKQGRAPKAGELVFLSPSFGPKAVPMELRLNSRFMMVVGEFAARYADVYGPEDDFPEWVGTAPGAELYIPGWVGFAVGK